MTALQDLPPTVTVTEAADILGISRRSAYRAAAAAELPTIKLGRRLLVPTARLLDLLGLPQTAEPPEGGKKPNDRAA
jgi:excisionase family DNA binding protein